MIQLTYYILGLLSGMSITGLGLSLYQHNSNALSFMVFFTVIAVASSFIFAGVEQNYDEDDK